MGCQLCQHTTYTPRSADMVPFQIAQEYVPYQAVPAQPRWALLIVLAHEPGKPALPTQDAENNRRRPRDRRDPFCPGISLPSSCGPTSRAHDSATETPVSGKCFLLREF
jgi:hypothetical protein